MNLVRGVGDVRTQVMLGADSFLGVLYTLFGRLPDWLIEHSGGSLVADDNPGNISPRVYGPFQENCNIPRVFREEKGTDPFCAQHPAGRSGKRGLSPFPLRKMLRMLQFFSNGPYATLSK